MHHLKMYSTDRLAILVTWMSTTIKQMAGLKSHVNLPKQQLETNRRGISSNFEQPSRQKEKQGCQFRARQENHWTTHIRLDRSLAFQSTFAYITGRWYFSIACNLASSWLALLLWCWSIDARQSVGLTVCPWEAWHEQNVWKRLYMKYLGLWKAE